LSFKVGSLKKIRCNLILKAITQKLKTISKKHNMVSERLICRSSSWYNNNRIPYCTFENKKMFESFPIILLQVSEQFKK